MMLTEHLQAGDANGRDAKHDTEPLTKQGKPTVIGHANPADRKMSARPPTSAPNHLALCFECTIGALPWRSRRRSPWIMYQIR